MIFQATLKIFRGSTNADNQEELWSRSFSRCCSLTAANPMTYFLIALHNRGFSQMKLFSQVSTQLINFSPSITAPKLLPLRSLSHSFSNRQLILKSHEKRFKYFFFTCFAQLFPGFHLSLSIAFLFLKNLDKIFFDRLINFSKRKEYPGSTFNWKLFLVL